MKTSQLIAIAVLGMFALPASAGTDAWTIGSTTRGEMNQREVAQLTATVTGATTIIQTSNCSALDVMTDDTDVTFDVQACTSMVGGCRTRNTPSPLDSVTNFGLGVVPAPGFIRLSIAADPPATFTMVCNP